MGCYHSTARVLEIPSNLSPGQYAPKLSPLAAETENEPCAAELCVEISFPSSAEALASSLPVYAANCTPTLLYDTSKFATEASRYAGLQACNVLDTEDEARFDALTNLACSLFDAPVSIVSLVYDDNLWFKSVKGPFGRCTEREGSICSYVMVPDHAQVLIIEDLSNDARFSGNPYVAGPPFIRFYAGCPLVASDTGHRYGTLCVLDFKPRAHLPPALYNVLCNLAELTVRELERDMHAKNSACGCGCEALATRSPKAFNEAVFLIDASETQWPILYANSAWCNLFGVELAEVLDDSFWSHFQQSPGADLAMLRARLAQGNGPVSMTVFLQEDGALTCDDEGGDIVVRIDFTLAGRDQLAGAAPVIVPGFISAVNNAPSLHALCQPDRRKSVPGKLSTQTAAAALIRASPLDDAARLRPECIWVGVATVINRAASVDSPRSSAAWSVPSTTGGDTAARRLMSRSVSSSTSRSGGLSKPKRLRALQLGPLVGVGSYGKVYRGMLGMKEVAVKVLDLSEITGRTEQAEKVLQEAALSRHLAHPNIVPTFDFVIVDEDSDRRGSMDQRSSIDSAASGYTTAPSTYAMNVSLTPRSVWIVQHYCDRGCLYDATDIGCLRQERARHSPPSLPAVLATALDVASGMEYLHEEGVVHGDLSGNNVLLTASKTDPRGFTAMVSDFGLSRPHQGALSTKTVGTITHQSPETLEEGIVRQEGDVYAFGVLLWEMYSGRRAWAGCHMAQIVFFVTVQRRRLELPPDAPQELQALLASCLDVEPTTRPTFSAIKAELASMKGRIEQTENC